MRATPKFQFRPVVHRLAGGNLALLAGAIAALLAAPLAPAIRAQAASQVLSSNRFLCIFDISAPMQKQSAAVQKSVQDILNSRASGQLHYGDTIGVWTFDAELRAGFFPLQAWLPGDEQEISLRLAEFLKRQPVGKPSQLGSAMAGVAQLIKNPDTLTVFIFSTGESPMTGTPFDQEINAAYQRALKDMKKDRAPIVTVLQAKNGRYLKYTVTALPWPIAIPELPIPIKLAKTQPETPAAPTPTPNPPPMARTAPAVAPPVNPPPRTPAPAAPPPTVTQPPVMPPAVVQTSPAPVVTPASPPPVAVAPPQAVTVPSVGDDVRSRSVVTPAPVGPVAPPAPDSAAPAAPVVVSPPASPRSEISRQRLATSGVQAAATPNVAPAIPSAPPARPPGEAGTIPNVSAPAAPAVSPRNPMPASPPATPPAPQVATVQKTPAPKPVETAVVTPPAGFRPKAKLIAAIAFLIAAIALGLLVLRRARATGPSLITRTMNDRRK